MDDSNVWLPHLDILQLAYEKNKSYFHSLNHSLRVWAFSMLLSEYYIDRVDLNVISAAALFHAVDRRKDWGDENHAKRSAKWIRNNLPIINPKFTEEQIDLIVTACSRQDSNTHNLEPLELKILSDADILDNHRLLRKKISSDEFSLPESKDLVGKSKEFYKTWKKNSSRGAKSSFEILKESLRGTPELRKYSNLINPEQVNNNEKRTSQKIYQDLERHLSILQNKCSTFNFSLETGSISLKEIKSLGTTLNDIDTIRKEGCLVCEAGYEYAKNTLRKCLKSSLPDLTLSGREREAIRKLYQATKANDTEYSSFATPYPSLLPLLHNNLFYSCSTLTSALKNYIAYNNDTDLLNLVIAFTTKSGKKSYSGSLSKSEHELSDLDFNLQLSDATKELWVLLRAIEELIDYSTKLQKVSRDKGIRILTYVTQIINQILEEQQFTIEEASFLLEQVEKILNSDIELSKGLIQTLFSKFQRDYESTDGITTINGGLILDSFNLFHQYDGSSEELKDFLRILEEVLIRFYENDYQIDGVIRCYLLPLALNKELDYSIDQRIFDAMEEKENIELVERYNTLIKKNQEADIQELTFLYIKENSSKNIQQLTNQSKHHALVQTKDDYKIVSKTLSFDIIESVLEHESFLLSPFNIVDTNPESMKYKASEKGEYQRRLQRLDALQRYTLTRRPDIRRDHVYYGTLQSMKDLLARKDALEKVPSPSSYIPKKKFGKIILVFKDKVKDNSFFTLHDSIWENRTIPVLFEEARYLYEEINSERLASFDGDLDGSNSQVEKPFVEASVLGGVELEDIEMIIAPKKLVEKHKHTVDTLLRKYQQIEILGV